jgi:hypothetical protein
VIFVFVPIPGWNRIINQARRTRSSRGWSDLRGPGGDFLERPYFEFLATAIDEEIWEAYPWVKG